MSTDSQEPTAQCLTEQDLSPSFVSISFKTQGSLISVKLQSVQNKPGIEVTPIELSEIIVRELSENKEIRKASKTSFYPIPQIFPGCKHYVRGCKVECPECHKFYPCRVCHDEAEDHTITRSNIQHVLCYQCRHVVPFAQECSNCQALFGLYCCNICKLIVATPFFEAFHCDECGLCRVGKKELIRHCPKCCCCIPISSFENHQCLNNALKNPCPVCFEDLFTSRKQLSKALCGHYIHLSCMNLMIGSRNYRCPLCSTPLTESIAKFLEDQKAKQHERQQLVEAMLMDERRRVLEQLHAELHPTADAVAQPENIEADSEEEVHEDEGRNETVEQPADIPDRDQAEIDHLLENPDEAFRELVQRLPGPMRNPFLHVLERIERNEDVENREPPAEREEVEQEEEEDAILEEESDEEILVFGNPFEKDTDLSSEDEEESDAEKQPETPDTPADQPPDD
ncbi:putative E3 ubiquitin-protein ligase SRFP1 [Blattamonas nauphoetae]|uniref:E3 ubiquitin-protein ligase SRFP1 n=1 Tax=Blattamonas nauphoetae TaxID=2049346 RepID=A0ABQ9YB86_9EUKA|nr:putative E3 ubiquitin-protein ligase SRFP1 [Blattamonas nauphoetae]